MYQGERGAVTAPSGHGVEANGRVCAAGMAEKRQEPGSPTDRVDPEPGQEERRSRYQLVERDAARCIVCGNAPNIALRVERGLTVDKGGRKRYPAQSVFLDGVYDGPPFYDNEARQYSLDHHAGCVRAFTLATCEQAVVMLLQGLPLTEGDWTLYVNEPDLDAVLGAWVLLNHVELLAGDRQLLRAAMPLVRLEGVIDAHGTGMELFAALPEEVHRSAKQNIERLREREQALKAAAEWDQADWVQYARDMLEGIDRLVYPAGILDQLLGIQEDGRVAIRGERMAVLIASTQGIYAVEAQLKARYGKKLGVVILDQGGGKMTLRQVDPFLSRDLTAVYRLLNRRDPKVRRQGPSPNLWGGSGDIGGSPRATGTGLGGGQVLEAVREIFGTRESWLRRLWRRLTRRAKGAAPPALPPGDTSGWA